MGMLTPIEAVSNPLLIVLVSYTFFTHSILVFIVTMMLLLILTLDSWGILNHLLQR